jgi:hypothetical protein
MLKVHNFQNNKHKLGYAYLLTPSGIAAKTALTARFLQRKMEEYTLLKAEIESLRQEQPATSLAPRSINKEFGVSK